MTRRRLGFGLVAAVLAAALVNVVVAAGADDDLESETTTVTKDQTVTVTRQTLVETETIDATVGHGTPIPLPIDAAGTVTWAPEQDDVLSGGDVVVRIDDRPVTLVDGDVPLYRELRRVGAGERDEAGDKLGAQTGVDVAQLQAFLLGHGFDDDGRLEFDGVFGASTERAVEDWQESVGHPATGGVERGQIIFTSDDVRVDEAPIVGQPFTSITVTTPAKTVTATATSAQRPFFAEGAAVELDVEGRSLSGTVTDATRTTGQDGTTRYELEITVTTGDLPAVASSVEVTATKTIAEDVITVPVRALLALAEGGWAVEVPTGAGTELVAVELGSIVDGTAEISGVDEGTVVVVPS